jgi:hypothetical protein
MAQALTVEPSLFFSGPAEKSRTEFTDLLYGHLKLYGSPLRSPGLNVIAGLPPHAVNRIVAIGALSNRRRAL